jgi:undecaprenyl-diphosphatase
LRIGKYVKPLVAVNLLLAVLLLGLLARTAPVTRRDLHIDRLAQQIRFPIATDVFLALTGAASEVVGIAALLVGVVALLARRRRWDAALTADSSGSLPTGHDTTACVVATVMAFRGASRARVLAAGAAVVFALTVGVSRVYLGDHYPTDVLGSGFVVAAATTSVWALCDLPAVRGLARAALRDPRLDLRPEFA